MLTRYNLVEVQNTTLEEVSLKLTSILRLRTLCTDVVHVIVLINNR